MRRLLAGGVALLLTVGACTNSTSDTSITEPRPTSTSSTTEPEPTSTTSSSTTTTTRAPSGPGHGGTAIIADDQAPPTLNPFASGGDNFIVEIIGHAWMTGVYDIDATTLERIPEVVTELPTVANRGVVVNPNRTMTVTYHIREGAVWSDGVPITADDFEFTLDTARAIDKAAEHNSVYTDAGIIRTEGDGKTYSITTRRATTLHESLFRWLIPKHAAEGTDIEEDWNTTTWPSGGPFVLDTYEQGQRITFTRNKNYWKTDPESDLQLPYLDSVEFVFIPETEEVLKAFRAREVDVIQPPPSADTVQALERQELEGALIDIRPGPVWEHISFQFGQSRLDRSPSSCNDNLAFRRAIAHAIDRDAAADTWQPGLDREPMQSYLEAYAPSISTGAWSRYTYDPDIAHALYRMAVEETGLDCVAIFNTTGNADSRPRVALAYEEMLTEAGIPIDVQLVDSAIFFGDMLDDGTWDIGQWGWVALPGMSGLIGAHDLFDPNGLPPKGSNYYRWGTWNSDVQDEHTKRFAEIVKELNATVDEIEIVTLVQEAEEILADQVVIIPTIQRLTVGAAWADEIGGFRHNPTSASHTWNIEYWYRTDR